MCSIIICWSRTILYLGNRPLNPLNYKVIFKSK
uniref:Uncharacterized protein n=1 Tax=Arundo donax TaxID=35708 RepID=A0A0A9C7L8_ARUDO